MIGHLLYYQTKSNLRFRFIGELSQEREANGPRRLWINTWSHQQTTLQVSIIGLNWGNWVFDSGPIVWKLVRKSGFAPLTVDGVVNLIDDEVISQQITYRYLLYRKCYGLRRTRQRQRQSRCHRLFEVKWRMRMNMLKHKRNNSSKCRTTVL